MSIERAPEAPLEDVQWRVDGKITDNRSVRVVAYLDVPVITRLMDEWVGPGNWRDDHSAGLTDESLWCHLSVWDADEERWVTKNDIGTESSQEATKGLVSDAFKRVAMRKWRVGANVFDLPILWINEFREYNGKAYLNDASFAQIRKLLADQGFTEAADAVRGGPDDDARQDGAGSSAPEGPPRSRPASTSSSGGPGCAACGESLSGVSGVKRVDGANYHPDCAPEEDEEVPF